MIQERGAAGAPSNRRAAEHTATDACAVYRGRKGGRGHRRGTGGYMWRGGLRPLRRADGDVGDEQAGHADRVERVLPDGVAPPVEDDAAVGVLEREEDEDRAEGDADVEAGGEDVVEAEPPAEVVAADEPLEEGADHRPGGVVDARRGRELREPCEADGDVDVPPEGGRVAAREEVEGDGEERADEEEVEDPVVPVKRRRSV